MVELKVESIRVSLLSSRRLVVLKEVGTERYLPIWIGAAEADAIAIKLQNMELSRPLTHDLLKNVIEELGATISYIVVSDLVENSEGGGTFYGRIVLDVGGRQLEIDSRPSDAIALAVRAGVPIFGTEEVMARAAITPSPNLEGVKPEAGEDQDLSVFREFIDGLDLDKPES